MAHSIFIEHLEHFDYLLVRVFKGEDVIQESKAVFEFEISSFLNLWKVVVEIRHEELVSYSHLAPKFDNFLT